MTSLDSDVESLRGLYGRAIAVCDRMLTKLELPRYDASFAKAQRFINKYSSAGLRNPRAMAEDTGLRPARRRSAAVRAKMSRAARKRWRQRWAAQAAARLTGG